MSLVQDVALPAVTLILGYQGARLRYQADLGKIEVERDRLKHERDKLAAERGDASRAERLAIYEQVLRDERDMSYVRFRSSHDSAYVRSALGDLERSVDKLAMVAPPAVAVCARAIIELHLNNAVQGEVEKGRDALILAIRQDVGAGAITGEAADL